MRAIHWEKLQKHLGVLIDPNSETFSLGELFDRNLLQYAESVKDICDVAREEFKIESAISKIEQKWRALELEMEIYKKSFKIRKADEVFSVLEDHMSLLSAQKTTLFYDRFKDDIERWEQTL